MEGYGSVELVNAKWNVPQEAANSVELAEVHKVAPLLGGRAYFADTCSDGAYSNEDYVSLKLLGKHVQFTVDLSGAGCGCNVAFYLTSLRQNDKASDCLDHYCDANSVCGVACAEIDIMEANKFAWHSTLHSANDKSGVAAGYGGGDTWNGARDWSGTDYGPGGRCINTDHPFRVEAGFPVDGEEQLLGMTVTLTQDGHGCSLSVTIDKYDDMGSLSAALKAGMTPIVSYWGADDMLWMDGKGADQKGPCSMDDAKACGHARPKLYGFSVHGAGVTEASAAGHSQSSEASESGVVCPGETDVAGLGPISLVNAHWNKPNDAATQVDVVDGRIVSPMRGRTYFGTTCTPGTYNNADYAAIELLGKTLRYTVDLSAASCGCNAALYLTSLQQNSQKSECEDYYCDANKVCGVRCAEIDIMEANKVSFYSTLHVGDDGGGFGKGYGAGRNEWNASVYGPGARCIDTSQPFQVAASFPVDSQRKLAAMEVKLTQEGRTCPLQLRVDSYSPFGRDGLGELTGALAQGMTPIISYWGIGEDMSWMDGKGSAGQGPCDQETPESCGETISFSDFAVETIGEARHGTTTTVASEPGLPSSNTFLPPWPSLAPTLPPLPPIHTLPPFIPFPRPSPLPPLTTVPALVPPAPWGLPGATFQPPTTPPPRPVGYKFIGFYRPQAARYACESAGRLAIPKTAEQQLELRLAVDSAIRTGKMSNLWPNNTIWLGGHWNSVKSIWEWDDGQPIGELNWGQGQPSSSANQLREPWLCMVQDGHVHDSDPPFRFGVFCEPTPKTQSTTAPVSRPNSNLLNTVASALDTETSEELVPTTAPRTPAPLPLLPPSPMPVPVYSPTPSAVLIPMASNGPGDSVVVQIHTPLPGMRVDELIMKKESRGLHLPFHLRLFHGWFATTYGLAMIGIAITILVGIRIGQTRQWVQNTDLLRIGNPSSAGTSAPHSRPRTSASYSQLLPERTGTVRHIQVPLRVTGAEAA